MLPKPKICEACPLYQIGMGFVPDHIPPTATVAILGSHPSQHDEQGQQVEGYYGRDVLYSTVTPQPFLGTTGWVLRNTFVPLARLKPREVSYHHLIKCRYQRGNSLPPKEIYEQAIAYCTTHHLHFSPQTQTIVAFGNTPSKTDKDTRSAWEYTQGKGYPISEWRGFLGPRAFQGIRVYGALSVAGFLRDPHAKFIARFDWKRLARLHNGDWPSAIPERIIASPATRDQFVAILEEALLQPEIMVDTEYIPDQQLLTHVGAAWRSGSTVHGFQLEWLRGQATSVERAIFMRYWPRLCQSVTMGFWNAKADVPILEHNVSSKPVRIEDPMQAHAVLWPDMGHDYGFVASIYGKYNKLKHLAKDDILLYHWGDMIDLVWIWEALKEEFQHDPACEKKYREQNLKLIPILLDTEARGIRVNQARIEAAIPLYQALSEQASQLATAYCGYPLNVGSSKQVLAHLQEEGFKIKSINQDIISQQRAKYLPFDAAYEEQHGFTQAYIEERVSQGAHPLLELRVMYATNQHTVSNYLTPLRGVSRVHPQINIHTQAGGRHSTTNPPLATIPNDLRDIVMPDEGTVWIGGDWDQQEPRIQRAESGSRVLGAAFDQGEDIHTTFVCQLYGWPLPQDRRDPHSSAIDAEWRAAHNWGGKEDSRRTFAKALRYELAYGGQGMQAAKKALRMGVESKVVKNAAQVLLTSDPELTAWFSKVEKEVVSTRMIHSWGGGRRVFYWVERQDQIEEMKRQARNFPPQGGGADLYNLAIIEVCEKVPGVRFVYGMHDSLWFSCPWGLWVKVFSRIKEILTKPRMINSMAIHFPMSMKVMYDDGRVEKVSSTERV